MIEAGILQQVDPHLFRMALFRWFDIIGVALCMGSITFRPLIFSPSIQVLSDGEERTRLEAAEFSRTKRVISIVLVYLFMLHLITLVHQAEMMSGRPRTELISVLPLVLKQTHFGLIWIIKLFLLLFLFVLTRFCLKAQPTLLIGVGALLCLTGSLSGHAVSRSPFSGIIFTDWIHYTSVSIWIGGLFPLRWIAGESGRFLRPEPLGAFLEKTLSVFSRWAAMCVMMILTTGMINATGYLGWRGTFNVPYGKVLLTKLVLVGTVLFLGAFSRFYILPLFQKVKAGSVTRGFELEKRFKCAVTIEIGFAALTLFLAALLTQTSPPHFGG